MRCVSGHVLYLIPCNQHLQHPKNYKNQKFGNKIKGDTEDSIAQGSKDREIELISRKVSKKRKGIQLNKLSDTQCESTVEELGATENIARKLVIGWV